MPKKLIYIILIVAGLLAINYLANRPVVLADKGNEMRSDDYRELTPEEKAVIINKGTEAAFTGKHLNNHEIGIFTCKQCGAKLFNSDDKFESGCGWPSFDKAIEGAVKRTPDQDGRRVEITCNNCGGHLGHVFEGEQFTPLNTRHCVNSISIDFENVEDVVNEESNRAIFAGGCFWGVEYYFENLEGVDSVTSGYTGGTIKNPTYEQVCSGTTGHAEAVEIIFNPKLVTYKELAKLFFEIHNPTQVDRQGPDIGSQYRSEIFYFSENQKQDVLALIKQLNENGYKIATKVTPAGEFYKAEDYHQDYYTKTRKQPYCHSRVDRFDNLAGK